MPTHFDCIQCKQKGVAKIILISVIAALGLIGFFLLNKPNETAPVVQENQTYLPQNNNSNKQIQGGYGNKQSFYNKGGISLQHYWPGDGSFSAEETEILLFNNSSSNVQVKSFDLTYTVEGKAYSHKSGTWEKFATEASWDRIEYINIAPQYYKNEPLLLTPYQKGKLHWHINFGPQSLNGKQTVRVKLTLLKDTQTINIDEQFNRDSGTVVSKDGH